MKRRLSSQKGQTLMAAVAGLLVVAIAVPTLVLYTQRESAWTSKASKNTRAFDLAEAGVEKAFLTLTESTITWVNLQHGTQPPGFRMDAAYHDIAGGSYTISITSGAPIGQNQPAQTANVVSVGIDSRQQEVRAIQAVFVNAPLGNVSISGGNGVAVTGQNVNVEWGSIISQSSITTAGRHHPRFFSAGWIDQDANGPAPPNCDQPNCWWWHSYYQNIPPNPAIDFGFYKSSAIAAGTGPCGTYYNSGTKTGSCTDTSGNPYFVQGDWTGFAGHIIGTVIILGNLTTYNGTLGGGAETVFLPQSAWKEYCYDWAYYTGSGWDPTTAAAYPSGCPGKNSTYQSPANQTVNISPVVHGLLYVGGNFTGPTGGGNTTMVFGVIYVLGNVFLTSNSHVTIYYGADAMSGVQTTSIALTRQSWTNIVTAWPQGLAY